jgi:hypothetical protein
MPVRKVKGGFKYGTGGKVYKQRWRAERQGRAIEMAKAMKKKKTKRRGGR